MSLGINTDNHIKFYRMKKLKKLSLKKETIVKLENSSMSILKGGCTNSVSCGNPGTDSFNCITKGDCDLHTIGHDDGSKCISKTDWGWCWCYGL